MYDHLKLGLAKHTDFFHQKQIEGTLASSFMDIRDALETAKDDVSVLEQELNAILYGEPVKTCCPHG